MPPKICIECNENEGKNCSPIDKVLCDTCNKLDKYTLITKTNAKNDYFLKDSDLTELIAYRVLCRYNTATLYNKLDIMNVACVKHNLEMENLENSLNMMRIAKQEKSNARKSKQMAAKQALYEQRNTELVSALQEMGLELRADSKLCQMYMNGETQDIEYVVKRMCEMKYLYDYCHMNECQEIAYRKYCEDKKYGYWSGESVSEMAEDIALRKYSNGRYPTRWPWM